MDLRAATRAAEAMLNHLPQDVHDALEGVALRVVATTPPGVASDVRGYFQGFQQKGDPDDDDDVDAGGWYDFNDCGELELAHWGGLTPAAGEIVLIADRIPDAEELERTLCHEIAHALGYDEWETAELGLE